MDRLIGRQLLAAVMTALETSIPVAVLAGFVQQEPPDPDTGTEEVVTDENFVILIYTLIVSGGFLTIIYIYYLVIFQINEAGCFCSKKRAASVLAQPADERGTCQMKRGKFLSYLFAVSAWTIDSQRLLSSILVAATRKINKILRNAKRMHERIQNVDQSNSSLSMSKALDLANQDGADQAVFQQYVLYGEDKESCASWRWVFKRVLSKDLYELEGTSVHLVLLFGLMCMNREGRKGEISNDDNDLDSGIWLPARLWTFQVMQIIVLIVVEISVRIGIESAIKSADEGNDELPEGVPDWVYSLVPTGDEVR